ncbi:hypothetical protein ES703_100097 [subsurface metagenome]
MPIKNIKGLLTQATNLPAAIEAKLPEGAPKLSTMLLDAAGKIPAVPDFPVEIPDLPAPPEFPEMPELPGIPGGLKRPFVTGVEVTPVTERIIPSPAVGVIPEVRTRRGM